MSVLTGLGCAALGGLLGPFLAALTALVPPAGGPGPGPGPEPGPGSGPVVTGGPGVSGPGATGQVWRGVPATRRRRVAVTVLAAAVFGAVGATVEPAAAIPAYLWFAAAGIALAVIDVDCHRLPDRLTLPSYPAGVLLLAGASAAGGDLRDLGRAVLAAAVAFAGFLLLALVSPDSLGLGDVKLAGLLGLYLGWLGWQQLLLGLVTGFLLGAVVAVVLLLGRRVGWRGELAFGPALLAGALVAVVAGQPLLDAYRAAAVPA